MTTAPRLIPPGSVDTFLEAHALLQELGPDPEGERHMLDLRRAVGSICQECDQEVRSAGLCRRHYRRQQMRDYRAELRTHRRTEANTTRTAQDVAEDVEFLLDAHPLMTAKAMAERLGYEARSGMQKALRRAGRQDLLDRLARNAEIAA